MPSPISNPSSFPPPSPPFVHYYLHPVGALRSIAILTRATSSRVCGVQVCVPVFVRRLDRRSLPRILPSTCHSAFTLQPPAFVPDTRPSTSSRSTLFSSGSRSLPCGADHQSTFALSSLPRPHLLVISAKNLPPHSCGRPACASNQSSSSQASANIETPVLTSFPISSIVP